MLFFNEELLSESSGLASEIVNCEANENPIYTPDLTGISIINNEALAECYELDEKLMVCDVIEDRLKLQENTVQLEQLQEGVMGDLLGKAKKIIHNMYEKVKGFFASLWKSIFTAVASIEKTLSTYSKDLDKDLSKYEYKGYKWNEPSYIAGITGKMNAIKGEIEKDFKSVESSSKSTLDKIDNSKKITTEDFANKAEKMPSRKENKTDHVAYSEIYLGELLGNSQGLTPSEARLKVTVDYRGKTQEVITGLGEGKDKMISFLKSFKGNKTLKKLQKDTDSSYSDAIKSINSIESDYKSKAGKSESGSVGSVYSSLIAKAAKTSALQHQALLQAFNVIMGTAISCEKDKFKEYKRAIIGAIKYNPSKKEN